jgi:hypothetical protein
MRAVLYILTLSAAILMVFSCKKEQQPKVHPPVNQPGLNNGILNFSINGQLLESVIDTTNEEIDAVVPRTDNKQKLTMNFSLASQVNATINNQPVSSGSIMDFSKPVTLKITSADQKRTSSFKIVVLTDLEYFGLMGEITAQKSLNRDYNFYFDEFDNSPFASINCGPAVSTMALKWADSTFNKPVAFARTVAKPNGGWWDTGDVGSYLSINGISSHVDTLVNIDSLVKVSIDNNNPIIFCLDMYYVPYNEIGYQHTSKFYFTNAPAWGHFILVKGYKQVGSTFYLEAYDPYSAGSRYSGITTQLKGQDRYYVDADIKIAAQKWWAYAIVVGQKGQKFTSSNKLRVNSIHKPIPLGKGQ